MTKWKYKDTFINSYCAIKVYTTNRHIHDLIRNQMDFNGARGSGPRLGISFYIDEAGSGIAKVTADAQKRTVKATVIDYRECHKERILYLTFFQPLYFILRNHGLFFLHASMVGMDKNCLLITGPQNCGKSTVALALAQNGFNLLSDDDCFIRLRGKHIQVLPFPTKMGLNDKILKKNPGLNSYILRDYHYGGKKRLSLNRISSQSGPEGSKCAGVIFPVYKSGCKNVRLIEMPANESLNRLVREHIVVWKKHYERMFWALYIFTKNARSFELIYNDDMLDGIPETVKKTLMMQKKEAGR